MTPPLDTALDTAQQPGFAFDPNKCTGCQACELACMIENDLEESWRRVVTLNPERHPEVPVIHLSMACNHCEDPPCAAACPALAYTKDPDTGLVRLDSEKCIGCGYCSWACPYDAPRFDKPAGVMTKCTFCEHRQAEGLAPACVDQCPTGALGFGPLESLPGGLDDVAGLPTTTPGPSLRVVPYTPQNGAAPESLLPPLSPGERGLGGEGSERKITLDKEWPLVAFTSLASLLVAIFSFEVLHHPLIPRQPLLFAYLFPFLAAASLGLSTLHLGRPKRAWRAMLNVRRSWLSREVVFYGAFVGMGTLHLLSTLLDRPPFLPGLDKAALVAGFLALFAMDRVYDPVRTNSGRPLHTGDTLLCCLVPLVLWRGSENLMPVFVVAGFALAYALRKADRAHQGKSWSLAWSAMRLVLLGTTMFLAFHDHDLAAGTAFFASQVIDRADFYTELEVPTPRSALRAELRQRLAR